MCSQRTRSADIGFSGGGALRRAGASSASSRRRRRRAWPGSRRRRASRPSRRWRYCRSRSARWRVHPADARQLGDHVEAVAVLEPHVDDGEGGGRALARMRSSLRHRSARPRPRSRAAPWRAPAARGRRDRHRRSAACCLPARGNALRRRRELLSFHVRAPGGSAPAPSRRR